MLDKSTPAQLDLLIPDYSIKARKIIDFDSHNHDGTQASKIKTRNIISDYFISSAPGGTFTSLTTGTDVATGFTVSYTCPCNGIIKFFGVAGVDNTNSETDVRMIASIYDNGTITDICGEASVTKESSCPLVGIHLVAEGYHTFEIYIYQDTDGGTMTLRKDYNKFTRIHGEFIGVL